MDRGDARKFRGHGLLQFCRVWLGATFNEATIDHGSAFDNAVWTKSQCTVSADSTPDPFGGSLADGIIASVVNGTHTLAQTIANVAAAHTVTIFGYAKAGAVGWLHVGANSGSIGEYVNVAGVAHGAPSGNVLSRSIVDVGNGWRYITMTVIAGAASVSIFLATADAAPSFAGDGSTVSMYLYGWGVSQPKMSALADQSGTNSDCSMATMTQQPLYEADGFGAFPAIFYNPNANNNLRCDSLATPLAGSDKPFLYLGLVKVGDPARLGCLFGLSEPTTIAQHACRISTAASKLGFFRRDDASAAVSASTTEASTTDKRVVRFTFTGTAMSIHIDGVVTSVSGTAANVGTATFTQAAHGATPVLSETANVRVSQWAVFSTNPDALALARMERCFKAYGGTA